MRVVELPAGRATGSLGHARRKANKWRMHGPVGRVTVRRIAPAPAIVQ
jgi:hypothetical protein